ncbi:MAG: hypothetical protein U0840_22620 [Gemmataceae bacterium]
MPNVQVRNLVVNTLTNTLSAGTYGRGMFELFLDNSAANSGSIRGVSGSSVWSGNVILTGNTKLQAELGAQVNFVGSISDQSGSGPFTISKTGQGRVVFSGVNSYGGVADIQEGPGGSPTSLWAIHPRSQHHCPGGSRAGVASRTWHGWVVAIANGQSNGRFTRASATSRATTPSTGRVLAHAGCGSATTRRSRPAWPPSSPSVWTAVAR